MGEIIKLKYPVRHGDKEITEVTLRRLKGKDLVESEKFPGELERSAFLISRATGLPMEVVLEMDGEDFTSLSQKVARFLL
jgi:hypothetical protein